MDCSTDFESNVKSAFGALMAATKAAARLPNDISFHRTLDEDIDARLDRTGQRTLALANTLWTKARSDPSLSEIESTDDIALRTSSGQWEAAPGFRAVVEAVDTLLEKIDVGLDEVLRRPAHRLRAAVGTQSAPMVTSVAAAGGRTTDLKLVHASSVPRPQVAFKDVVDNSVSTPFVWKIREKLNALVPLDYGLPGATVAGTALGAHLASLGIGSHTPRGSGASSPRNDAEESALFDLPHPYAYEIKHQPPPAQLFVEQAPQEPNDWDETPFAFVDTPAQLAEMIEHLEGAAEVAIDLEHHNYRSYHGFTCLVQISSRTRDFVVDALALRSELHQLNRITTDPRVVKVLHGAESDIVWLQRDFGVYVVGMFDTYHASHVLNMGHHSLAHLLKEYCAFDADKKYQLADWRIRPVPAEMLHYARADTHFLLYIYDRMRNEILQRGRELVGQDVGTPGAAHFGRLAGMDVVAAATQPLELALQRSATTAMNRFVKESYDADHGLGSGGWAALLRKWRHPFSPVQMAVLRALHQWRDTCAREEDESTRYVLPNHMLYALADRMPTEPAALLAACQPTPPLLRLYASDVARLVVQAKTRAEERMAEFRGVIEDVHNEVRPMRSVHTRFNEPMDAADDEEPATDVADVLTPELMSAAAVLMSPGAALFGRLDARPQQESEAMRRAREIRSNLVLTVVMPSAVLTGAEDMEIDVPVVPVAAKRPHAAVTAAAPANQPVVLSETYAKYQPEQAPKQPKRQKTSDLDNLPTISLGDISSS
ncbi:exosome nuclease subunit, partial [Kickxella alabastrina]